ncbi:MAG: DUF481 domain-containing protein [Woeseiaceae bacterium]|nr:DUF481 domain-containing protein [Woeseiaceae bacterium]NIP22085.1 DUF481 domain-containing protein [Woeseiaceae bacterium]NIS91199.1 DUF481 domain-containing protein [Woeseiaceae bacterium]
MSSINKMILWILFLGLYPGMDASARDKTDLIFLVNGDRITGEIKQLDRGRLQVKTDSMGDISIEWDDVERVESDYQFQFERTDGTRVTGKIQPTPDERSITLQAGLGEVTFQHDRVVRISQIEDSFWERLQGSLSFGYSFTKASDVAQTNLGFRATHRTEERAYTVDGGMIITDDQANKQTARSDLRLDLTRFRSNRWFNSYMLGFEVNDELGLDLRSSFGAGMGRYLIQTNTSELALIGGLAATYEDLDPVEDAPGVFTGESSQKSLEAVAGLKYAHYIFDEPTVDLTVRMFAFPSLTQSGRTRAQLDVNLRWELIKDLFWELNYYNTFDSDPPSGAQSTNDYGVVTSVGWSF